MHMHQYFDLWSLFKREGGWFLPSLFLYINWLLPHLCTLYFYISNSRVGTLKTKYSQIWVSINSSKRSPHDHVGSLKVLAPLLSENHFSQLSWDASGLCVGRLYTLWHLHWFLLLVPLLTWGIEVLLETRSMETELSIQLGSTRILMV